MCSLVREFRASPADLSARAQALQSELSQRLEFSASSRKSAPVRTHERDGSHAAERFGQRHRRPVGADQIANPKGRPKGSRNRPAPPPDNHDRLQAIILQEAYRTIPVNDAKGRAHGTGRGPLVSSESWGGLNACHETSRCDLARESTPARCPSRRGDHLQDRLERASG
jgi:hypothetical protein